MKTPVKKGVAGCISGNKLFFSLVAVMCGQSRHQMLWKFTVSVLLSLIFPYLRRIRRNSAYSERLSPDFNRISLFWIYLDKFRENY